MATDDTKSDVNAQTGENPPPVSPQTGESAVGVLPSPGGSQTAPEASGGASGTQKAKKAPTRRRGRPRKARGAANTGDTGADKWTVRGVPTNVRRLASAEAEARGMTVGDWVSEAIAAYAKGKAGVPATSQPENVTDALAAVMRRLEAIEADRDRGILARLFGGRK